MGTNDSVYSVSRGRKESVYASIWLEELRDFTEQSQILKKWEPETYIDKGTFSRIFKVVNRSTGAVGALKFVPNPLESDDCRVMGTPEERFHHARFESSKREAEIMHRFHGVPGIVQYLEEPEFLQRAFVNDRGETVTQYAVLICMPMYKNHKEWAPMIAGDREKRLRLGMEIASALMAFEKEGVYHRDIKPGNILMDDGAHFCLGDVGEAKLESEFTTTGFHGTRPYMAPEVYLQEKQMTKMRSDHRSDIYSLGIILYRLFNNQQFPFLTGEGTLTNEATESYRIYERRYHTEDSANYITDSERARLLRYDGEELPRPREADLQLAQVILRACAYDKEARYQSAKDLYDALECCVTGEELPQRLRYVSPAKKPVRPAEEKPDRKSEGAKPAQKKTENKKQKNVLNIALAVCVIALAALIGVIFFALRGGSDVPPAAIEPAATDAPAAVPTDAPTSAPTATPTSAPTATPTSAPTATPTAVPTATPTAVPTATPTSAPTATPTAAPVTVTVVDAPEDWFEYELLDDGTAAITGYHDTGAKGIAIPAALDGKKVSQIGAMAFDGCSTLEKVVVPDGVTLIDVAAFQSCENLAEVILPQSLETIEDSAFNGCALVQITLPDGLNKLGVSALARNHRMTSLHIPAGVTDMAGNPVTASSSLETLTLGPQSLFSMAGGALLSHSGGMTTLLADLSAAPALSYTTPQDVQVIGEDAFFGHETLETLVISHGVTEIADYAFAHIDTLQSVTIPDSVLAIGSEAFIGCDALAEVRGVSGSTAQKLAEYMGVKFVPDESARTHAAPAIPEPQVPYSPADWFTYETLDIGTVTITGYTGSATDVVSIPAQIDGQLVRQIGYNAFGRNAKMAKLVVPGTVRKLAYNAVSGSEKLTEIVLGEGVVSLEDGALSGNTALKTVYIPSTLTEMTDNPFSGSRSISSFVVDAGNPYFSASGPALLCEKNGEKKLVHDASFGSGAQYTVPQGVTEIGVEALRTQYNSDYPTTLTVSEGVKSIAEVYSPALERIELPSTLESVAAGAFSNSGKLQSVTLHSANPNYQTDGYALYDVRGGERKLVLDARANSVREYTVPAGVTIVGVKALYMGDMQFVVVPAGVKTIESNAFDTCEELKSISLPASLERIDPYAFADCSLLLGITIDKANPYYVTDKHAIYDVRDGGKTLVFDSMAMDTAEYTVPDGVTALEEGLFGWNFDLKSVTIPASVKEIGKKSFMYCWSLESVQIQEGAQTIGERAFYFCDALRSIRIPDSVESIGEEAFYGCAFESITIGNGVRHIGDYAFGGCKQLKSVTIPMGAQSIGEDAFAYCDALESVSIGESVTQIGEDAFRGCSALKEIRGAAGSAAQTLAQELGVAFVEDASLSVDGAQAEQLNATGDSYLYGDGVEVSYETAAQYYLQAAQAGYARGMTNIGFMYREGLGVERNDAEALKWFEKAAQAGEAESMNALAIMYFNGEGVTQDYAAAVDWFRKSAEVGDLDAMHNLGYLYENGLGVKKDSAQAQQWYRSAANLGHADSQAALSRLTATPSPTPKPTPTPTPKKTATPKPTAAPVKSAIEINSNVSVSSGKVTVTWTDSASNGPYKVSYEYYDPNSTAKQSSFWAGGNEAGSTTSSKSFTFDDLIPGRSYIIEVKDSTGKAAEKIMTMPAAAEFVDGKLKANSVDITLGYRYRENSSVAYAEARTLNSFKASEMMANMNNGYKYGLNYKIEFPRLATDREFETMIAIYAPNGYAMTVCSDTVLYKCYNNAYGSTMTWYALGEYYFDLLYKHNGSIPTGQYTVELYWNGMFVNTSTFSVN